MKLYPDLGVPGSTFNKTFVDLYADKQMNDPYLLAKPEWPLVLADRTAAILHVSTGPTPIPPTPNPSWIDKKRQEGNKLETPAYDKKRNVVHTWYTPRPY